MIEDIPFVEVVGEASTGTEALDAVNSLRPNIVILDIDIPEKDGVQVARELCESDFEGKVIFLTMHKDQAVLRSLSRLGVAGYLLKDSALTEIDACLYTVLKGKPFLSHALADLVINADDTKNARTRRLLSQRLSSTELRVLRSISEGFSNQEIAATMFLSVRTVETHRYRICLKLGLSGPNALFKFALTNKESILQE